MKAEKEGNPIKIQYSSGSIIVNDRPSPYDAALTADFIRYQLLAKGVTFTFETVLSHPSKIEFLKHSKTIGYKNYLYFICTVDPAINIERVKIRVQQGGHGVPEDKIVKRYYDSLNALSSILPSCHSAYFFDNSTKTLNIEPIAEIDKAGKLIIINDIIPSWLDKYVVKKF